MCNEKIWVNGMRSVVVGDALGVPVQFASRIDLKINPVKKMEGYGRFYMPPETWSDDSSLALATLDSIREMGEINYPDICERFVRWLFFGSYTPAGQTFDVGDTCKESIRTYDREKDYRTCGKTGEQANGDGADQEELDYYERLFRLDRFAKCKEDEIKSTGYVVASLEAAIWSLITTCTVEECLLKAVNLGDDTDTIGAIAGGLACLYYGYESVPEAWRKQIIKEEKILALCKIMEERF